MGTRIRHPQGQWGNMTDLEMPWAVYREEDASVYHSCPLFGKKHDIEHGGECWCHPRIERNENGIAVFHEVEQ